MLQQIPHILGEVEPLTVSPNARQKIVQLAFDLSAARCGQDDPHGMGRLKIELRSANSRI
jgi:hypothetical protein